MASCCELDLGTLAFHESVTECALGLTLAGTCPAEELDEVDAHGGTSCASGTALASPWVGACGRCPPTWAMLLMAREPNTPTTTSILPHILIGFDEYLIDNTGVRRISRRGLFCYYLPALVVGYIYTRAGLAILDYIRCSPRPFVRTACARSIARDIRQS